jgi:hypothetical protein
VQFALGPGGSMDAFVFAVRTVANIAVWRRADTAGERLHALRIGSGRCPGARTKCSKGRPLAKSRE